MEEEKDNDTNLNKEYEGKKFIFIVIEELAKAKQMKNDNNINASIPKYSGLLETLDSVETEIWKRSSPMNNFSSEQSTLTSKTFKSTHIQTDPINKSHEMISFGVQTDPSDSNKIEPRKDENYSNEDDDCEIVIVKRRIPDYHLFTTRRVRNCLNLSILDDEEIQIPQYPKRNVIPIP